MGDIPHVVSEEEQHGLDIARKLIEAGIAVFAAPPCPAANGGTCGRDGHAAGTEEYDLPPKWQLTVPSMMWLEQRWRPGWGLAAVGGRVADFLDEDPRNGGTASVQELSDLGHWPRVFGVQRTPSGGFHYLISALHERKGVLLPGLDYQGGATDGQGRGFVWIAPTVRRSKVDGTPRAYQWVQEPDLAYLAEYSFGDTDDSGEHIVARLQAVRALVPRGRAPGQDPYANLSRDGVREFTLTQAMDFCRGYLEHLAAAPIGQIEDRCNSAAVQLSHFVGPFWSADQGMDLLRGQLALTAYSESHPASRWTVEKFRAVLDGRRPPHDNWTAVRVAEPVTAAGEPLSEVDQVDVLERQLMSAEDLAELPAPVPLVYGLLDMNSEAWIIGAPGSFKSFVALDLAAHVGAGRQWHGYRVRRENVLYVAAEGANGMTLRTRAWQKEFGVMVGVDFLPLPIQVSDARAWDTLVSLAGRRSYGLVVIDTQHRVSRGLDENSARDAGVYTGAVTALREATGACVLTVHHTGRNGQDARGSSAIDGAQDTELKLTRVLPRSSMRVLLKEDKQKDQAEDEHGVKLRLKIIDLGTDPVTDRVLSSLIVAAVDDPYAAASEEVPEMPEEWEVGHGPAQIQLYKVLRDQGGDVGLTKAEARAAMVERFYGGVTNALAKTTYYTAWTKCRERLSRSGDPVMVNPSGEKWTVDPVALADLEPGGMSPKKVYAP